MLLKRDNTIVVAYRVTQIWIHSLYFQEIV